MPALLTVIVAVIDGLDVLSQGWYDHVWLRYGIPAGLLILCLLLCPHLWQEAWEHLRHGRVTAPAAALLCGRHDYTSFCANRHMKKSAVRTVDAITVERLGDEVRLTFSGDGFLYHMVRILTGTLLEVGLGQRDADTMPAILAARDRAAAGPTAPARGLILWETRYARTHPEVGEEKRE